MNTITPEISESTILARVIATDNPTLPPSVANELLKWGFSPSDRERMAALAANRSIKSRRARSVLGRCLATSGNVLLFSHGHFSRMLATMWLELPPSRGRSFGLKAGSISVLGFEHANRVIWQWDRVDTFEGH